jgi:hypothetical protein
MNKYSAACAGTYGGKVQVSWYQNTGFNEEGESLEREGLGSWEGGHSKGWETEMEREWEQERQIG